MGQKTKTIFKFMTHSREWCEYILLISFQNKDQAKQNTFPPATPVMLKRVVSFSFEGIIEFSLNGRQEVTY